MVNNQTLAQQLATGKVQVATINGQQVLIRPTGNNQAQVVAQLTPGSITQTVQQNQPAAALATPTNPVKPVRILPKFTVIVNTRLKIMNFLFFLFQVVRQPPPSPQAPQTPVKPPSHDPNHIDKATMDQLLVGQPPGTVIKCVTAQVIQTQAGPRIVLQGLQGADFTQQQLAAVQQQVKQQLLKGKFEV